MRRLLSFGTVLVLLLGLAGHTLFADGAKPSNAGPKKTPIPADAKATLENAGLKVTSGRLSLREGDELEKSVRELGKQKKAMMAADREVFVAQRNLDDVQEQINELKRQHTNLSAELAKVVDTLSNNRIVGALNVIAGQIEELDKQRSQRDDELNEARKQAGQIRDDYVQQLASISAKTDSVATKWNELAADTAVKSAVEAVNEATGRKFALEPPASFAACLKNVKKLEAAVSSEAIKLDNESNSLWVEVTINGKHKQRLIVDSGATIISLPDKIAREMGIELGAEGEPVEVGLADGRKVPGTKINLDSVRVGKFTVENVECCVLGPDAPDAPALLGMSFLGQFKFEVDIQQSKLKLVKVDSGEPPPKEKKKDRRRAVKKTD